MSRALFGLALALYLVSCLVHCAGASDLVKYERALDSCTLNAASRAQDDACRAKVKAAFDAAHYSDGGPPEGGGD